MNVVQKNSVPEATRTAAQHLLDHWKIDEEPVALFVSGGSSLDVFRELIRCLSDTEKARTSIYQADERYGSPNHEDSNWTDIQNCGLDGFLGAHPMLLPNHSAAQLALDYENILNSIAGAKVAILGLGADSHTAGIKPMSPAEYTENFEDKLVAEYQWTDFHRLTLTAEALLQFDGLYVYATGASKLRAVKLLEEDAPPNEQPIQSLLGHSMINIFYSKGDIT